jgi:hypothetical protein
MLILILINLIILRYVIDKVKYHIYAEEYILTVSQYGKDIPLQHSPNDEIISCSPAFYPMDPEEKCKGKIYLKSLILIYI